MTILFGIAAETRRNVVVVGLVFTSLSPNVSQIVGGALESAGNVANTPNADCGGGECFNCEESEGIQPVFPHSGCRIWYFKGAAFGFAANPELH